MRRAWIFGYSSNSTSAAAWSRVSWWSVSAAAAEGVFATASVFLTVRAPVPVRLEIAVALNPSNCSCLNATVRSVSVSARRWSFSTSCCTLRSAVVSSPSMM